MIEKRKSYVIRSTRAGFITKVSSNIPNHSNGDLFLVEDLVGGRYRYLRMAATYKNANEEKFVERVIFSACIDQLHVPHENPFRHVYYTFKVYMPRYMFYWLQEAGGSWNLWFDGNTPLFEIYARTIEDSLMREPEDFPRQPGWSDWEYATMGKRDGLVRWDEPRRYAEQRAEISLIEAYDRILDELTPHLRTLWQRARYEIREIITPNGIYIRAVGTLTAETIIHNYLFQRRSPQRKVLFEMWKAFWQHFEQDFPKSAKILQQINDVSFDAFEVEALLAIQPTIFNIYKVWYRRGAYDQIVEYLKDNFFGGNARRTKIFLKKLEHFANIALDKDAMSEYLALMQKFIKEKKMPLKETEVLAEDEEPHASFEDELQECGN